MTLKLTANKPVASQADLFSGAANDVYADADRQRGDDLRSLLLERGMGHASAAKALGITEDELRGCLRGAYAFELAEAKRLLRGGK